METRYLKYILTIARCQNMTKAAEELYVSQSSLSQYLSKLEKEIGVSLFERTHNKLILTPAGELYVKAANQVINIQKELYHAMRSQNNKSHITLGVTTQLALKMLTEVIPSFKEQFTDVTIEISESNVPTFTRQIQEESLDCAVMAITNPNAFAPSQVTKLGNEDIVLAVPKDNPFCNKHTQDTIYWQDLHELEDDNFLLCKSGSTLREATDKLFASNRFNPNIMCETNSIITTRAMVAMGIGITFLGKSCIKAKDKIRYYRLSPNPNLTRTFILVSRKNWVLNTAEQALCDRIIQYFKKTKTQKILHY